MKTFTNHYPMKTFTNQYSITKNGKTFKVELKIDLDAVALVMVNNAARNSSGVAKTMYGHIIAKVIE